MPKLKALVAALLVALTALGAACGGENNVPVRLPSGTLPTGTVPSRSSTTPTAESQMVRPASQDGEIWDQVVALTSANISPILRPASLPEGFESVTIVAPNEPSFYFNVEYAGQDKRLSITAQKANPGLVTAAGHSEAVQMRNLDCNPEVKGKDCSLSVYNDANPKEHVVLHWNEPGRWVAEPGQPASDSVEYFVFAEGVEPRDLLAFAESLVPASPH